LGVALSVLRPSASPERVWLYAAELDECFARAAQTDFYSLRYDSMRISPFLWLAQNLQDHQLRGLPTHPRRFPTGQGNAKDGRAQAKRLQMLAREIVQTSTQN
jgi:hypothetical protein